MIYGHIDYKTLDLVVGAADKIEEYQEFYRRVIAEQHPKFTKCTQPEFDEMLTDFGDFREPPYVFVFPSTIDSSEFSAEYGIKICPYFYVVDKQQEMLRTNSKDDYFSDKRTIGEMYGLNEHDPWDTRTDEEKENDEKNKKLSDEAKKKSDITGDSFVVSDEPTLQIDKVRVAKDADGNVKIDNVLAHKGLYSEDIEIQEVEHSYRIEFAELVSVFCKDLNIDLSPVLHDGRIITNDCVLAHRLALYYSKNQEIKLFEDDLPIEPSAERARPIRNAKDKIYYKLSVDQQHLQDILPRVEAFLPKSVDRGETTDGCWIAFHQQTIAKMAELSLKPAISRVFPVGVDGIQLIPDGFNMFEETKFVEPPRPWNDMADQLSVMSQEELEKNKKSLTGKEFFFSGSYIDAQNGCAIYITPKSYFEKHEKSWTGSLDISEILPQDIKEVSPGVYQTRSREWMSVYHDLQKRGFAESMTFQLDINLRR